MMVRFLICLALKAEFNMESAWLAFADGFTDAAALTLLVAVILQI